MLKDGGNKNGKTNTQTKKNSLATTTKTTTTLQVLHTSFLHFFVVVLHDHSVKLSSYTFLGGNVSCSQEKFCFLCSCSLSFSLPLIFTILAAKIYHFHFQIWLFFSFLFFVLSVALALSLLRLGFVVVVVVFLFLKVRVAKMTVTSTFIIMLNTGCSLDRSFHIGYPVVRTEGRVDRRKGVRSRDNQNFSHAWITKFSYPWCSTGELRYTSFNYHPDFLEVKDK